MRERLYRHQTEHGVSHRHHVSYCLLRRRGGRWAVNLLAGALIILPLLVIVGGTLIVCAVAAYLNLKAPYRKKALFFSLLLGSISAVGLLLPYTREFALSTALASALALGSALGIFALSKRRIQAL